MLHDITSLHKQSYCITKKKLRAVYNLPSNDYLKLSNILKLEDLYKFNVCNYLYRSNNSINNRYISYILQPHYAFHDCNTRDRNNLVVRRFVRSWSQRSFLYRPVIEFNTLPHEIKIICSLNVFKLKLKNHYCSGC